MGKCYTISSLALLVFLSGITGGCNKQPAPARSEPAAVQTQAQDKQNELAILLPFAQFNEAAAGRVVPGAAKLVILHKNGNNWRPEIITDSESNVFHKAYCRRDAQGKPGIITIGANGAKLKYWQRQEGRLTASTWYSGEFGGKWNRLRDIEEADINNDGTTEQIIATHDQGVILLGRPDNVGKWQYQEIMRRPDTFIHEIEVGDLDGDRVAEFYATPSEPNKAGVSQNGEVVSGRYNKETGRYEVSGLLHFSNRHAKEILVYDFDGDGRDELYVSLEARLDKDGKVSAPLEVLQVKYVDGALKETTIASLDGVQARVLTPIHLAGPDKPASLLVTTMKGGIFILTPDAADKWNARQVDKASTGFEHPAGAFDSDGDGIDEIFVVADNQHIVSQYTYENGSFNKRVIMRLAERDIVWNVEFCEDIP